jgi:uncharacterized protein YjcR
MGSKLKRGRRTNPIPPGEIRIAFDMFLDRNTQKQIARIIKVSPMTIHRWSKKYGWKEEREKYLKDWMGEVAKEKIKRAQRDIFFG